MPIEICNICEAELPREEMEDIGDGICVCHKCMDEQVAILKQNSSNKSGLEDK